MNNNICCTNIVKRFNHITAVNNVSFEIEEGKFYGIMGKSGSGKTTLLSLIGLLDNATSGDIHINGINISNLKDKEKAYLRMNELGFVFQDYHLNPILKAYENVMIPMYINPQYRKDNLEEKAKSFLQLLGLSDRINHYPSELSGGEKQRVSLARALANNPNFILADEPTGNLDTKSEKIVFEYLKQLTLKGKTVVVVSHNPIIKKYSDITFEMYDGTLEEN